MNRIAIIGAGAMGRQIAYHVKGAVGEFEVVGFYDDSADLQGDVLGRTKEVESDFAAGKFDCVSLGLGYNVSAFRGEMLSQMIGKVPLATIVSKDALVDGSAYVDEGCTILKGTIVDQGVKIGPNCFMSLGCSVSHETVIGANVYFSPRVTVCGNCRIGRGVFLGAGCVVRDGVSICDGAVIGCGAVVVKDITTEAVYAGNPARMLRGIDAKRI